LPVNKKRTGKSKKLKNKAGTIEFLEPSESQKQMAGVYGGEARPEVRRANVKYDKDRHQNSKKFRLSEADEPNEKPDFKKLASSDNNLQMNHNHS